jgi:hypothetical protein
MLCPVCSSRWISPLLEDFAITARQFRTDTPFHSIAAYRCHEAHIFFVQQEDVSVSPEDDVVLELSTEA